MFNHSCKPSTSNPSRLILDSLLYGISLHNNAAYYQTQLQYLQSELIGKIDSIVANPRYHHRALSERLATAGLLPMFGFPTRVRLMFTQRPWSTVPWPPEHGTVDRGWILPSVSSLAFGSQIVKDKEVRQYFLRALLILSPQGNKVFAEDGFAPPINEPNIRLGICTNCKALAELDVVATAVSATSQVQKQNCPVCQATSMLPVDAREPKGFFTNFRPEDFEGAFEFTPVATRPSIGLQPITMSLVVQAQTARICGDSLDVVSIN